MKDLIVKYLNNQYLFTISTHLSYKLYDRFEKKEVGVKDVLFTLQKIFSVCEEEMLEIFDEWADEKDIELINRITDIRKKFFAKNGVEMLQKDMQKAIEEELSTFESPILV